MTIDEKLKKMTDEAYRQGFKACIKSLSDKMKKQNLEGNLPPKLVDVALELLEESKQD